jgi:hypothetical protein
MRASRYGLLVRLNGGQIDADNLGLGVSVGWMSRVSGGWRGVKGKKSYRSRWPRFLSRTRRPWRGSHA